MHVCRLGATVLTVLRWQEQEDYEYNGYCDVRPRQAWYFMHQVRQCFRSRFSPPVCLLRILQHPRIRPKTLEYAR